MTFRRAPKAKIEVVTRLRSIWDGGAGTENADAADDGLDDLDDAED